MTWIQTYTGVQFWPLQPREEDVRVEDIAHALSNMCRFNGHCREFYSVAQHSVLVAQMLMTRQLFHEASIATRNAAFRAALLHDAAEAYLVDLPRPIKPAWEDFENIEQHLLRCIHRALGMTPTGEMEQAIKYCDGALLATEARDLMGPPPQPWEELPEPWDIVVRPVAPGTAKALWLASWLESE